MTTALKGSARSSYALVMEINWPLCRHLSYDIVTQRIHRL